jgi:hypothetical protein
MRSLPSFKYILNPRAKVNQPRIENSTATRQVIASDNMKDLPMEYVFQPMEDGRVFVTPSNIPEGHITDLLPKAGTRGQETLIDGRTGLPVPVLNAQSKKERFRRRKWNKDERDLFPRDIGKTIVLNSPEEARQFISNITADAQYQEFNPDLNMSRHQKAAAKALAFKQKRFNESGRNELILKGDAYPWNYFTEEPFTDDDIDRIVMSPSNPNTVPRALERAAATKRIESTEPIDTYSDMPQVEATVLRDLRRALKGESITAPRAYTTEPDTTITEGFDYERWSRNRNLDKVPAHSLKVRPDVRFAGDPTLAELVF